jgi:hypothetical protein
MYQACVKGQMPNVVASGNRSELNIFPGNAPGTILQRQERREHGPMPCNKTHDSQASIT